MTYDNSHWTGGGSDCSSDYWRRFAKRQEKNEEIAAEEKQQKFDKEKSPALLPLLLLLAMLSTAVAVQPPRDRWVVQYWYPPNQHSIAITEIDGRIGNVVAASAIFHHLFPDAIIMFIYREE